MTNSARYLKRIEEDRVHEYLASLNKRLDEVRGWIVGKIHLPSIREVYFRSTMRGKSTQSDVWRKNRICSRSFKINIYAPT